METVYFIGIGGSGMLGLASLTLNKGINVIGSDISGSDKLDELKSKGAKIYSEHSEKNINENNIDLLVYSGAIKSSNPEIIAAKKKGIKCISRSKYLGMFMKNFKNSIAVSGSHGKTTTSSMITNVLVDTNKNPTSIIGAFFPKIKGNSTLGNSDIAVCEACEYLDSFLDLDPKIGVILNIDNDHLDYFKTLENEKKSFHEFAKKCEILVINADDDNSMDITKNLSSNILTFGIKNNAQFMASDISLDKNGCYKFDLVFNNEKILNISLKIPGKHNIYNALSSVAVCRQFDISFEDIKKSIEDFSGADRRFTFWGSFNNISIFDDFAHHPTEIEATLKSAKQMKFNKIWLVFQPHTFSRTYLLLDDLAKSLSIADKVILTDILPVRETNIYGISSEDLSKKIENSIVIKDFDQIADYLKENVEPGDMILTMGGGDIYKCTDVIYKKYRT